MTRRIMVAVVVLACASAAWANEIGYVEDFALAKDRTKALEQLIPGTREYYYYRCLHLQNQRQFGQVEETLKLWTKRYGRTARVREIENRQALLRYAENPQGTLDFLIQRLNVRFNHEREILGRKPKLPTALDAKAIDWTRLADIARRRHPRTLGGFEDRALERIVRAGVKIGDDERRHLLRRLRRPDLAGLAELIVADLNYKSSRGFGAMGVHRALTRTQLDGLLKLKPDLLNQSNFVTAYLTKLRPSDDEDWQHDTAAREAYLERLWEFVDRLAPVHNSLKACVLYHRLVHDRAKGVHDKQRFMTYVRLPRNAGYVEPKYLRRDEHRRYVAQLNANYQAPTMLPPVRNDEPLVRSYLMHFFAVENDYKGYAEYISDTYLKRVFAETKIVHGLGDMEKWASMLTPTEYQALKERVDLDFAPTNKTLFAPGDPVALDLWVKNVRKLIVKVYEINAMNYYRTNLREMNTDINLDGLVPNDEAVHQYGEPPLRRVRRHFEFPKLARRGLYVVEFIGNGMSSRALIRKGRLSYISRTSTAGQILTVLDEANRKLPKAGVWLAGHEYRADKDGQIVVPYSTAPRSMPVVLFDGEFASLDRLAHRAESYALAAGIYVDREALLNRRKARVVVRPTLYLNGEPVTLTVLEEVTLVITSRDLDGVNTAKEVKDFKLFEDRESSYEFKVPARLHQISFLLKAKVKNLSRNKKEDLRASAAFTLNEIDRTEKVEDLHLLRADGKYYVDLLGKTGEPKPDRPVNVVLKHRDFKDQVHASLQTNAAGRVALGELKEIVWVRATGPEGTAHTWHLASDLHSYPSNVHGRAGEAIHLPYMGAAARPLRSELSLLEVRGGSFVADRFAALAIRDGFVVVQDLPAGDYNLLLKDTGHHVRIRLTGGEERLGYVMSGSRQLELRNPKPLQVAGIDAGRDAVKIRLRNATKFARVHVFATRFAQAYPVWRYLGSTAFPEPSHMAGGKAESVYVSGRNIGDEYRYILERKYHKKLPGNMLTRPSLLLNPWAIRTTDTGKQDAKKGAAWGRGRGPSAKRRGEAGGRRGLVPPGKDFANLDFLADAAAVLLNAQPDKNGVVTVDRKLLGSCQYLHVVAVDPLNTAYRRLALAETRKDPLDLRLANALDPGRHYTEQKQITLAAKGRKFVLADLTTSKLEVYDSLAKVYSLYATLSKDPKLIEFGFLRNWPKLKPEQKREKYSKYACHELSFFLSRKDPAFFEAVVLPYLKNKKDKTFLDHWLLGDDLSGYLKPWAHARLNIVERILLAQRIRGEAGHTARHVGDLFDLLPPNIERFNHLFRTAIKGSALDTGDRLGLDKAAEEAEKTAVLAARRGRGARTGRPGLATAGPAPGRPRAPTARPAPPAGAPEALRVQLKALEGKKREEALAVLRRLSDADRALGEERLAEGFYRADASARGAVRQLYRKLDKTKEWVENNYYHLPIEQQNASLITVNAFWRDYARWAGGEFRSRHVAEASRNFPEMMLALAVLDLPFESPEHQTSSEKAAFTLVPAAGTILFHKEIKQAPAAAEKTPILVSQNFFRRDDRYRHVNNERLDKYVTDEFLVHVVYGCQVVITNPTSSRQKLDVLLQVPRGAMPVLNGKYTRGVHVDLQPYHTQTLEYCFYFPGAGDYPHYPVHVAKNEKLIAFAKPFRFHVVEKLSKIDKTSWAYLSQHGTDAQVMDYMKANNVNRVQLAKIAWRMKDADFFRAALALLSQRHVYDHTLWSYGLKHNDVAAIREYLQHRADFVGQCGEYLVSPLLTIDPVVRNLYQHMEYSPLVNARAHQLGKRRRILNQRFHGQYHRLMKILSYKDRLDRDDLMAVTYYLLLQDRAPEATGFFARVDAAGLATRLQHDYFKAYMDFFSDKPTVARAIVAKYAGHPVDRWRKRFAAMAAQLDEIEGKAAAVIDTEDRTQLQTKLAATEPALDFKVESRKVVLNYQNLAACTVNYYLMDIELLFSRQPFVQQYSGQFAFIRPNATQTVKLPAGKKTLTFDMPKRFHNSNVMVEITAAGVTKAQAYFANSLAVQIIANYGHVRTTHAETGRALPKVYVKVYARMKDGRIRFYKDGYTDLRGRFDYTSLNTNEIDFVQKFSILILSEDHGAVVREADPPKR